jgi:4-carboxymuconolactone decarboxylase
MTSIARVSPGAAGPLVKLAYFFTRRSLVRLTGRNPERMLAPLEVYAHVPGLLRAYGGLEQATAKLHRVDERLRNLAELKAASATRSCSLSRSTGTAGSSPTSRSLCSTTRSR